MLNAADNLRLIHDRVDFFRVLLVGIFMEALYRNGAFQDMIVCSSHYPGTTRSDH